VQSVGVVREQRDIATLLQRSGDQPGDVVRADDLLLLDLDNDVAGFEACVRRRPILGDLRHDDDGLIATEPEGMAPVSSIRARFQPGSAGLAASAERLGAREADGGSSASPADRYTLHDSRLSGVRLPGREIYSRFGACRRRDPRKTEYVAPSRINQR
jgi:hypothetical protein